MTPSRRGSRAGKASNTGTEHGAYGRVRAAVLSKKEQKGKIQNISKIVSDYLSPQRSHKYPMPKQTDSAHDRPAGNSRNSAKKKRRPTSADGQLGESIRAHRLILGMSQSELAEQLGVSFQQVQKYEKGANRIGAGRLPQIAEIFNVPIGALFRGYAETMPGLGKRSAAPVKLITDPTVLKLLTAYADITEPEIVPAMSPPKHPAPPVLV
jgi:transcriptional regulator with XRE-family HTH domain